MAALRCVGLRVTGRVQGVGYRAWMVDTATRLGLRGWVRNRRDGSVEALAIGDDGAVTALIEACRQGPRLAQVADIAVSDSQDDGSSGFTPQPTAY
ncbi:MAG: acylphosphatase [Alphaproteobacteria bacterium]|nr:acylphosphatase [Alphaproteobacteria bacterium]